MRKKNWRTRLREYSNKPPKEKTESKTGNINKMGLLPEEQEVMDSINDTWGKFLKLKKQHPSDEEKFCLAVHLMQGLMAMRIIRRDYPEGWYSTENKK